MKKLISAVLVLVMVLSLAACGKKGPSGKYGTQDAYISFSKGSAVIVSEGHARSASYSVHGNRVYITEGLRTMELEYDAADDSLSEGFRVYPHFR